MESASDPSSLPLLIGTGIAIIVLLFCSALFSGSETALTTASRGKLHNEAERGNEASARALKLTDDKERLIGAILLGNNLVNILATSLATMFFTLVLGEGGVAAATLVMTALVLVFAEVLPKTYAITNAEALSRRVSRFMKLVVAVAAPVVGVVQLFVRGILRAMGVEAPAAGPFAAHEEIAGAITLHHYEGGVEKAERDRLLGALDLSQRTVEEVMTHRRDVEMIDVDQTPTEIIAQVLASPHSRLPLFRGNQEDILGILHTKDLSRAIQEAVLRGGVEALKSLDIPAIAMQPYFVPEVTRLDDQIHEFLRQRTHIAVVIDEYGAMRGVITLEDIIEEIVGDIQDEHDIRTSSNLVANEDGSVDVVGDFSVRDLNRAREWDLPEEDAVTIAGLAIHRAGHIPSAGDVFEISGYRVEIIERDTTRVTRLRVRRI